MDNNMQENKMGDTKWVPDGEFAKDNEKYGVLESQPDEVPQQQSTAIHPALDDKRLRELENEVLNVNQKAYNSALRKQLLSNIHNNRQMSFEKDLGPYDFPFEGASSRNIPTIATIVDAYLDKTVNPVVKSVKSLDFERRGFGKVEVDQRKKLQELFDEELKSGRFDLTDLINTYFKTLYIDGIVATRVIKEKIYDYEMTLKPLGAWMQDPNFEQYYLPQIQVIIGQDVDISQLPPDVGFTLKERKDIERPRIDTFKLEDFIFNLDATNNSQMDFKTVLKGFTLDELNRLAESGYYDREKVEEISKLIKDEVIKKYKAKQSTGDAIPDDLYIAQNSNLSNVQVGEMYFRYDIDNCGFNELCVIEFATLGGIGKAQKLYILKALEYYKKKDPVTISVYDKKSNLMIECYAVADTIYALHGVINKTFNDQLDSSTLNNSLIIKVVTGKGYDPDDFLFAPSAHWLVENPSDVDVVNMPATKNNLQQIEQMANAYVQKRVLITDFTMASSSSISANETARGIAMIIGQSNGRLERVLELQEMPLSEILNNYFQALTGDKLLSVILSLDMFNISREINVAVSERIFGMLIGLPEFQQDQNMRRNVVKMMFDALDKEGFDELYPPPAPVPQAGMVPPGLGGSSMQGVQPPVPGAIPVRRQDLSPQELQALEARGMIPPRGGR